MHYGVREGGYDFIRAGIAHALGGFGDVLLGYPKYFAEPLALLMSLVTWRGLRRWDGYATKGGIVWS